ncbi:shikimate 5-dehydrogenase [Klebsiella pneumoniae]|nr:shikimate 5-dehydrogenase [Klebsiella pneumoniae]
MARDLCWACVVKGLTRRGRGRWWLAAAGWDRLSPPPSRRRGVSALTLYDTRPEVAHALAGRLHQHYPQLDITLMQPDPAGHELVVNATPLGMKASDPLPLDVDRLAPGAWVGEVVMTQEYTPLLRAAQARQCHIQRGTDMLFEMIPAYLRFFDLPVATPEQLRTLAEIRY